MKIITAVFLLSLFVTGCGNKPADPGPTPPTTTTTSTKPQNLPATVLGSCHHGEGNFCTEYYDTDYNRKTLAIWESSCKQHAINTWQSGVNCPMEKVWGICSLVPASVVESANFYFIFDGIKGSEAEKSIEKSCTDDPVWQWNRLMTF
jgi:hypothetical protein